MKYSIADLMDKYIILRLKKEHGIHKVQDEIEDIGKEQHFFDNIETIQNLYDDLKEANKKTWELEDSIGYSDENLSLDELAKIGNIALEIGIWNGRRIAIKNKINRFFLVGFTEYKTENHRSYKTLHEKRK